MDNQIYLDVEAVIGNGTYSDTASYEVVKLMMKANVVTIRNVSVEVKEIEVTNDGVVRFHGNRREM
ncbi:hypothetical protein [Bacillus sp. JJ1562]|uniref:hypothetical protein n=1 Tax=Bacillus sp. JJ1562 TaxID=3122960 RepID=UPI003003794C